MIISIVEWEAFRRSMMAQTERIYNIVCEKPFRERFISQRHCLKALESNSVKINECISNHGAMFNEQLTLLDVMLFFFFISAHEISNCVKIFASSSKKKNLWLLIRKKKSLFKIIANIFIRVRISLVSWWEFTEIPKFYLLYYSSLVKYTLQWLIYKCIEFIFNWCIEYIQSYRFCLFEINLKWLKKIS